MDCGQLDENDIQWWSKTCIGFGDDTFTSCRLIEAYQDGYVKKTNEFPKSLMISICM